MKAEDFIKQKTFHIDADTTDGAGYDEDVISPENALEAVRIAREEEQKYWKEQLNVANSEKPCIETIHQCSGNCSKDMRTNYPKGKDLFYVYCRNCLIKFREKGEARVRKEIEESIKKLESRSVFTTKHQVGYRQACIDLQKEIKILEAKKE